MIISDDIKLDYSDVLIRPKRSTLTSRFDVDMNRTYTFCHSKKEWTGVPIMAANMDTVGTFEMHKVLSKYDMVTSLHDIIIMTKKTGGSYLTKILQITFVLWVVYLQKI